MTAPREATMQAAIAADAALKAYLASAHDRSRAAAAADAIRVALDAFEAQLDLGDPELVEVYDGTEAFLAGQAHRVGRFEQPGGATTYGVVHLSVGAWIGCDHHGGDRRFGRRGDASAVLSDLFLLQLMKAPGGA